MPSAIASPTLFRNITSSGMPICYWYCFSYSHVFFHVNLLLFCFLICYCYSLCLCTDQFINDGEHLTICWCYYHSYCYCYCFTDQCINDGEHLSVRSLRSDVSVANSRDDRDCEQQGIWKIPLYLIHDYCQQYFNAV